METETEIGNRNWKHGKKLSMILGRVCLYSNIIIHWTSGLDWTAWTKMPYSV